MLSIPSQLGYTALFGLVLAESAGAPVPGETALLTAGVLAGTGRLSLPVVIAVAVSAAIIGDGIGYWIGRRGGRAVLLRAGPFAGHRARAVEKGEAFFGRHGAKTVFMARFVPGVRVVGAVMAGASAMPWGRFTFFNVTGALAWATVVAGGASLIGPAGVATASTIAVTAAVVAAVVLLVRARRRRRARRLSEGFQTESVA